MKITKFVYVLRGRESGSKPFVSDVLHDSFDESERLVPIGLDVVVVVPVQIDLSDYGRAI